MWAITKMKEKIVIGVAGMPGAGKATVREMVQALGYPVVVMGDVVRDEVKRRKLELTPENIGYVMLKLREEEGPAAVAKRCLPKIEDAKYDVILVDGIRSLHEVEKFKRHFPKFILIAIHSSPETRFRRLFERGRSDDSRNREVFAERDLRELSVGLGNAIATADYLIVNEGTKAQLERKVHKVLETVIGK
jgi:dephospho-CoA kinase